MILPQTGKKSKLNYSSQGTKLTFKEVKIVQKKANNCGQNEIP